MCQDDNPTVSSHIAPEWTIYPFVSHGYRPQMNWFRCILSLARWHTETINSWTMIANMISTVYLLQPLFSVSHAAIAMALAVCIHNPCSVMFHTFMPVSKDTFRVMYKLDGCAIFLASLFLTFSLASCVFSPVFVFLFTFVQTWVVLYCITQLLAASTFLPSHVHGLFIARCMFMYLAPMVYHTIVVDTANTWANTTGTIVSFAIGGVSYMVGFPQITRPVSIFHSHALMHCCLISAQWFMVQFLISMEKNRIT